MSVNILLRLVGILTAVLIGHAFAGQTTYRWIDPKTGGTVISDQPPPPGAKMVGKMVGSPSGDEPSMPYATRRASEKFPVVLYTNSGCVACKQARDLLNGRGIPFSEKVVAGEEELAEIAKQLGGPAALPSLRVGRQGSTGFTASIWNELLDAAGYPATAPYGVKRPGAAAE